MKIFHAWVRKLTVFLLIICHFQSNADSIMKNKTVIHKGIHKRGLFYPVLLYPYNACSGILVAIAVPLNLPNRNVFVSYNFEANYNMPNQPGDSVPGMINRFPGLNPPSPSIEANAGGTPDDIILKRSFEKSDAKNSTEASIETETEIIVEKRSVTDSVLLSRKGVYRLLESRLNANMLNGKKCLLLAICESSKYPLLEANGVLGHVFHIVLTPSTSMEENLPPEYAKAENLGRLNDCQKFKMIAICFKSFVITVVLTVQTVEGNIQSIGNNSEARFVPPPPPFAPPLLFPINAATGILVAIAIPVPIPELNIFVSYNFEANYNMPNIPADSVPGPLVRLKLNNPYPSVDASQGGTDYDVIARNMIADSEGEDIIETTTIIPDSEHEITERSVNEKIIFTRKGVYRLLESRMNASGINGKKCLLLAICESAKYPFLESNGVTGHVLHIILTPSSSADENLPEEYTKAEKLGISGNCKKYETKCNVNVLGLISKIL